MELGMVGLGRMGANIAERVTRGGHRVVGFDPQPEAVQRLAGKGGVAAPSLGAIVERLTPPRAVWLMVPSGDPVDQTIDAFYGEGFELLSKKAEFALDLRQIAEIWRYGSVVRSWLLDLAAKALAEHPNLEGIAPYVEDSGEGRWTVIEAIEQACAIPVISMALEWRSRSRETDLFSDRLLAALRAPFGGHPVKRTT